MSKRLVPWVLCSLALAAVAQADPVCPDFPTVWAKLSRGAKTGSSPQALIESIKLVKASKEDQPFRTCTYLTGRVVNEAKEYEAGRRDAEQLCSALGGKSKAWPEQFDGEHFRSAFKYSRNQELFCSVPFDRSRLIHVTIGHLIQEDKRYYSPAYSYYQRFPNYRNRINDSAGNLFYFNLRDHNVDGKYLGNWRAEDFQSTAAIQRGTPKAQWSVSDWGEEKISVSKGKQLFGMDGFVYSNGHFFEVVAPMVVLMHEYGNLYETYRDYYSFMPVADHPGWCMVVRVSFVDSHEDNVEGYMTAGAKLLTSFDPKSVDTSSWDDQAAVSLFNRLYEAPSMLNHYEVYERFLKGELTIAVDRSKPRD